MREVCTASGDLDVPEGMPTKDFAEMEVYYRHELWPPVARHCKRVRRRMYFWERNTKLHYQIYDVWVEPKVTVTELAVIPPKTMY